MYENGQQYQQGGYGGYNGNGMNNGYGALGGAFGSLLGGVGSLMTQNPMNSAMPYYNQVPGVLNSAYSPWMGQQSQQSLNPYLQLGQNSGNTYANQANNLVNNPTGMMNQIGAGYQSSPGYNWQVQQSQQAANNAAAAGGMAGSQAEQQNIAGTVGQLANQNYWQYVNNGLGMYNQGLGALQNMYGVGAQSANNMYSTGANMANNYGQNMAQSLMNQGGLAYNGQINQNQSQMGGLGAIGAGVGGLLNWGSQAGGLVNGLSSLF